MNVCLPNLSDIPDTYNHISQYNSICEKVKWFERYCVKKANFLNSDHSPVSDLLHAE